MTTGIRHPEYVEEVPESWDYHFQEIRLVGEVDDVPSELHYYNEVSRPALRLKVLVWFYNSHTKRYSYELFRVTLKGDTAVWGLQFLKVGDTISVTGRLRSLKVESGCSDPDCFRFSTDLVANYIKKCNGSQTGNEYIDGHSQHRNER